MDSEKYSDIEALQNREKRYRLLLDTMNHGVQENDCKGTITYSNRAHHEILGYESGELLGKKIWEVLPTADEQELLKHFLANLVREQPEPAPYLTQNLKKDGSLVDLQIDWNYEPDVDGTVKGFISVITDITDRKKSEENLQHRTQGLATLLEVSKNLARTLDLQSVLQVSVEGVAELVGLDTAAVYLLEDDMLHLWATTPPLPEQFPDELRIAPLSDHPHIREAVASGEPLFVSDFAAVDRTPAERSVTEQRNIRTVLFIPLVVDAKTIGSFIVGSVGKTAAIAETEIGLARTLANLAALTIKNAQLYKEGQKYAAQLEQVLADRIQGDEEREKLQNQLIQAQKMETVGRLAGGVAHDFNNMLTVIFGQIDLTLLKITANDPVCSDLMQIRHAAQRSANLIHQLLAFARKQTIAPKLLDLNYIIDDMLKMLRRLIGEDINLAWMPGDNLGLVKIDPAQVDQILANLCVNARDAISVNGKVTIETSRVNFDENYCSEHPGFLPGPYVMLALSDNGAGMDKETLSFIFEPFYSTKEAGKGTGLGLATVYGIVKQNNGFINVYSEPGKGTTVKIYLPKHEAENGKHQTKTTDQPVQGGSETVLLVEDEPMILDLCKEMLDSLGYQVLAANSPTEALKIAKEYRGAIDLLITDVVMPEMNGRELAVQLETSFPGLKTLYISGYTANVIAHHGVLSEGVVLLSKPFSKNELAIKVRETISLKTSG